MTKRYATNPVALLLLPRQDKKNKFYTVVRNPETEVIIKVNAFGYSILKVIDENPNSDIKRVSQLVSKKVNLGQWQVETKITNFIENMVGQNIIIEK